MKENFEQSVEQEPIDQELEAAQLELAVNSQQLEQNFDNLETAQQNAQEPEQKGIIRGGIEKIAKYCKDRPLMTTLVASYPAVTLALGEMVGEQGLGTAVALQAAISTGLIYKFSKMMGFKKSSAGKE